MVRNYKKKTANGSWSDQLMRIAIDECQSGQPVTSVARKYKLPYATLYRYVRDNRTLGRFRSVFTPDGERKLLKTFREIDRIFFGMTRKEFRTFVYEYAICHKAIYPWSWSAKKRTGEDWFYSFLARHPGLSFKVSHSSRIRPLQTYDASHTDCFYRNLSKGLKNGINTSTFYHMDECAIFAARNSLPEILAGKNPKEMNILSNVKNKRKMTGVCCCNAAGHFLPPFTIFSRKQTPPKIDDNEAMPNTSTDTGWITGESFHDWLKFFVETIRPTNENKVLLLVYNHDCHKFYPALNYANRNNVIIISAPPNAGTKMVPLKDAFHDALRNCFKKEVEKFVELNRQFKGKISQYDTAKIFSAAFAESIATENAIKTFESLDILYNDALKFTSDDLEESEQMALDAPPPNFGNFSGEPCESTVKSESGFDIETHQNNSSLSDAHNDLLGGAAAHVPFETIDLPDSPPLRPKMRPPTFTRKEEAELIKCFHGIDRVFFGMTKDEFRVFVYHYARENGVVYRRHWDKRGKAGEDWLIRFMIRHPDLLLKIAESCSINNPYAERYYTNLCNEIRENNIDASTFYNMEECGILVSTNELGTPEIFTENKEGIEKLSTDEGTEMISAVCCCNADGHFLPIFTVFSRKLTSPKFGENEVMPNTSTNTGWITGQSFLDWLKFFVGKIRPTSEKKVLLLVDNYTCHKFYPALKYAKENNVIIVSAPPNAEPVMIPLKVGFCDILKNCFKEQIKEFLEENREFDGEISQSEIAKIFSAVHDEIIGKEKGEMVIEPPKMWSLYKCLLKDKNKDFEESESTEPKSPKETGELIAKTEIGIENDEIDIEMEAVEHLEYRNNLLTTDLLEGAAKNISAVTAVPSKPVNPKVPKNPKNSLNGICTGRSRPTFSAHQEEELVEHFREIDRLLFGMTTKEFRTFAYQYAKHNGITYRPSWEERKKAGDNWLSAFNARHPGLHYIKSDKMRSIKKLKTPDRSSAERFYNNLSTEIRENAIIAPSFYHMDECGILITENGRPEISAGKCKEEINVLSTPKNTQMMTAICCCNAFGHFLPPFTIFCRKQTPPKFDDNQVMPNTLTNTGCITGQSFLDWLKFFVEKIRPSSKLKVLLLVDNYDCHKFYPALDYANQNNVIIISAPPKAEAEMVPLKVAFHDALINCFREEVEKFVRSDRQFEGKISQYDTAKIFSAAYEKSVATENAVKTFRSLKKLHKNALEFRSENLGTSKEIEVDSLRPNLGNLSGQPFELIMENKDNKNVGKTVAYTLVDASCIVRIGDEDEQNDVDMETVKNVNDPLTSDVYSDLLGGAAVHIPFETVDLPESVKSEPESGDEDPLNV